MEMSMVGGCVRDEILGIRSKDIDFAVVLDPSEIPNPTLTVTNITPFEVMEQRLREMGFDLIDKARKPEHFTARGFFPKKSVRLNTDDEALVKFAFAHPELAADFVLARKEGTYTDGRRPDSVEVGTLMDDLARRDFTMNAIAKSADGTFIDPFNGRQDIDESVIRAVGDAFDRLSEDALRAVRALRFSVTKGFRIDTEVKFAMESARVLDAIVNNISDERIEKELSTMFRFDTLESIGALHSFPLLTEAMFAGSVSLDATMKTKGRGR